MKIKQMLEDFWEGVMEVSPSAINNETICIVTDDNMKNYTRKLIEAVGEEIIGKDEECTVDAFGDPDTIFDRNDLRDEQRRKLEEILSSLK